MISCRSISRQTRSAPAAAPPVAGRGAPALRVVVGEEPQSRAGRPRPSRAPPAPGRRSGRMVREIGGARRPARSPAPAAPRRGGAWCVGAPARCRCRWRARSARGRSEDRDPSLQHRLALRVLERGADPVRSTPVTRASVSASIRGATTAAQRSTSAPSPRAREALPHQLLERLATVAARSARASSIASSGLPPQSMLSRSPRRPVRADR